MLCGFAKRDVTPKPDVFLAGNGEYQSVRVNDPLFVRAMVLADGKEWAALVSCDLLGVERETILQVRKKLVAAGCGWPANVLISCTHTHNGPHTRFNKKITLTHRDEAYLQKLSDSLADAIIEADSAKVPVKMKCGRGYALENFNRRITEPDGITHFFNPKLQKNHPDICARTHGIADKELGALQFVREDGAIWLTAVHYAAHPLTIGLFENVISADFPGAVVSNLEAHYGAPAVFFQGACGDLHSKGLFEGYGRMKDMGKNLSDEAVRVLSGCAAAEDVAHIAVATRELSLPVDKARRDLHHFNPKLFRGAYECEMAAVRAGPLAFVTAPGEITGGPGLEIKWHSPFMYTWVLYNCNSYAGYIANRRAYLEGGYEGDYGQCLARGADEIVVKTAGELLVSGVSPANSE